MKRNKPLVRKVRLARTYMVKSPPRRIAKESPEETAYKHWLHTQPCVVTGYVGELVQAAHMGSGGMGQKKGSWFDAVPMHAEVHREWDGRMKWSHSSRETRALAMAGWIRRMRTRAISCGLTGVPDPGCRK